ncbi:hypothetical protein LQ953_09790 [Sphingomonas sp. IC-56]|uniref:hypothetical protein n=1 Tax=Sphingomonas sp. IC-56 TaxID=2898529 RepID=UPI001E4C1B14|nr:hypothetical protein [Sphingomonas sp. IC-56]MCD2324302.1 hypothetical protein [Sphingomonas sp. IC-56]
MSEVRKLGRVDRVRPWAALLLPPTVWYGFEVGLASLLKADCQVASSWIGLAWGLASLSLCGGAAAIAWPLAHRSGEHTPPRAWLARVAMLLAGIFALAIAFQTLGILIVPACIG